MKRRCLRRICRDGLSCLIVAVLLTYPLSVTQGESIQGESIQSTSKWGERWQTRSYDKPIHRGQPSAAVRPYWDQFRAEALENLRAFFHDRLGTPKSIYGRMADVSALQSMPEVAAREFLRQHAALFRLRNLDDLTVTKVSRSPGGTHIYFQQFYRGVRVYGAEVSVHINNRGEITTVTNSYEPDIRLNSVKPSISSDIVYQRMLSELASYSDQLVKYFDPSRELVIYPMGSSARLAWRIVIPLLEPEGTWEAFWDALTGERLSPIVDKNYYLDGTGRVFIPNPIVATGDTSLRDMNDSNAAVPDAAYTTVTLLDLDGSGFLRGPFVNTDPTPNQVNRADGDFTDIQRGDNGFEEVETYWALDTAKRYFDQLGFFDVMNYSIGVNATGINDCNAFYSSFGNGMGQITLHSPNGTPDAGEDAEVTWHEYGHAIMDNQRPNIAQNFDGMGEGFGDYMAFAMARRENPDPEFDFCLSEWFSQCFTSDEPACLRRMDLPPGVAHWPEHRSFDPHFTGEIWSAALADLAEMIEPGAPPDTTTSLVLEANFRLPGAPSMPEGAEAVSQADQDLFGGANQSIINQVMTDRGLLPQPYKVTSPTEGDFWQIGSVQTITWETTRPSSKTVVIMISRTGGDAGSFSRIARVPNTGSFTWTVTGPETTQAVIRVKEQGAGDTYRDHSTGVFTIGSGPPPSGSITVTVPNGGEDWPIGSMQTIQWTSTGSIANVKIELSRDGGSTFETLFASTPNDGSESWTVTGPATTNALIRISDAANPATTDSSDAPFTISQPPSGTITVLVPNGGEVWPIGSTQTIRWDTGGLGGNVKIRLSRNGGARFRRIVPSTPNDGEFQWVVTGPATSQALIQVVFLGDRTIRDASDGPFTISTTATSNER